MEDKIIYKTDDLGYSKSYCIEDMGLSVHDSETKQLIDGERLIKFEDENAQQIDVVLRFKNGLLCDLEDPATGDMLPAVEGTNGHIEHFKDGLLHMEKAPAVVAEYGKWEEWFYNGQLIEIHAQGELMATLEGIKEGVKRDD